MKKYRSLHWLLPTLLILPSIAHAQTGAAISSIFLDLLAWISPLWIPVAILVVIIAGFSLILSQDEGRLEKTRKTLGAVAIGGIFLTIFLTIGPTGFIGILYHPPGFAVPVGSADALNAEAEGLASWIAVFIAIAGVIMVVLSLIQATLSFGGDEAAYTKVRTAIFHVVIGIIVVTLAYVLRTVMFEIHEPSPLLQFIAQKLAILLTVILTIAVAVIIYAGVRMILSIGKEDEFTSARSLVIRVGIGIIVILLSYAMVVTVANIF